MDRKSLAAAFPVTVPVLMGYLAIGMAFGFMLQAIGYNFIWAFFMSLTIYAGSGQYLGVSLLSSAAALSTVAVMTLLINFRHLVYGLSMLEKFRGMGLRKFYMIFSLTDETYALLSSVQPPVGVDPRNFYFSIALLDQSYWILGSVIGAVAGALLPIDTTGIDFAMTALFVVIAVDQWSAYKRHLPALLGAGVTLLSLFLVGAENMLLPALGVIVLVLLLLRQRLDERGTAAGEEETTC
ncbi:AzlC family ABC transporter permease [Pseudoflavonifractor sp. DSM 107456]|uniref:AzlC family ABC transporter permease n=2 Tax=Pseudoflavonifractor TaxID=1017280 RepID=A0ABR9R7Y9_9FIRM|nr:MULTISPECIES: AzlC family ABC transporter permease [Eubacteriales]MBC5730099.1 AzlC family ABC transporter permease [Pseudoflavonifractor hominis]MBE5054535.1 AzlC family ABC transporter permease [Pseudoflavonifractor gallinarum]MBS5134713.1 AzlC family ABC transporter permease [Oscillospiraceae bacterium]